MTASSSRQTWHQVPSSPPKEDLNRRVHLAARYPRSHTCPSLCAFVGDTKLGWMLPGGAESGFTHFDKRWHFVTQGLLGAPRSLPILMRLTRWQGLSCPHLSKAQTRSERQGWSRDLLHSTLTPRHGAATSDHGQLLKS